MKKSDEIRLKLMKIRAIETQLKSFQRKHRNDMTKELEEIKKLEKNRKELGKLGKKKCVRIV